MNESTAGHGPSKGFSGMNNHLKKYFRKRKDPTQQLRDAAFTRTQATKPVNPKTVK